MNGALASAGAVIDPGIPATASAPRRRKQAPFQGNESERQWQAGLPATGLVNDPLFYWEDVPKQLQYNKYVRSGYRAGLSRPQCLCSLFQYHNETGNIHIHLMPALIVLVLLATQYIEAWPQAPLAFWEAVIPTLICLSGSVAYHTFMANHWNYYKYLLVDVCGVFLVLVCGAWSGFYWGMLCHPWLRNSFIAAYYLAAATSVVAVVKAKTQVRRAAPMLGLLAIRLAAVLTRLALNSGSRRACWLHLAMEVCGASGAIVNISRYPEKWMYREGKSEAEKRTAGIFDYWLNSHQIMHIFVLFALLFKFLAIQEDYKFRFVEKNGC